MKNPKKKKNPFKLFIKAFEREESGEEKKEGGKEGRARRQREKENACVVNQVHIFSWSHPQTYAMLWTCHSWSST